MLAASSKASNAIPAWGPCCNATTTCCGSGAISGLKNLPNGVSASSLR
ncbi:Uncharacterised protein [Mycobacterium tuberculosis]|uniref:Uncharacterized protein n=1 Tax=Mycobacterium tuberculosis TaxID=1773 RepID=A0A0U0UH58_MYCTX|nr:Uncharacterised protein [Mycobacterium tuberculosis]COV42257.1 Uncharacterised protein [Mycobacterium tuberculosis]COW17724.1 Uncharacterised protein [Mycobacterium tuberculosis]COZ56764.1 Uncharacterised protein [Mycobacterium tuberculosis]